jgi:hypothetical protein
VDLIAGQDQLVDPFEMPRNALIRFVSLGGTVQAASSGLATLVWLVSARMQVVLFRRRRREFPVPKLLVSRRADELERFQKWSDTPASR